MPNIPTIPQNNPRSPIFNVKPPFDPTSIGTKRLTRDGSNDPKYTLIEYVGGYAIGTMADKSPLVLVTDLRPYRPQYVKRDGIPLPWSYAWLGVALAPCLAYGAATIHPLEWCGGMVRLTSEYHQYENGMTTQSKLHIGMAIGGSTTIVPIGMLSSHVCQVMRAYNLPPLRQFPNIRKYKLNISDGSEGAGSDD